MFGRSGADSRPIFFLHVPKTAGTSLRLWLCEHVAPSRVFWIDHRRPDGGLTGSLDGYDLVGGHACYRFVDRFTRPPRVITFLRDPIERALSAFYFFRHLGPEQLAREGAAPGVLRACELDLDDFLVRQPREAQMHLGNAQTWMLARERLTSFSDGQPAPTADDLETARANLARCEFAGLTERMEESVVRLRLTLGWPAGKPIGWANQTEGRPGREAVGARTRQRLAELTALDRELYRFATELFEQRRGQARPGSGPLTRFLRTFWPGASGESRPEKGAA